jgi:hypothetical protein
MLLAFTSRLVGLSSVELAKWVRVFCRRMEFLTSVLTRDHSARHGVITLASRFNSSQLKNRQFLLSLQVLKISEPAELG